jgi:putative flippase GtrA
MARWLRLRFVRFVLVGVLNTGFSYGVYALLLYLGLNYVVANASAVALGVVFSFKTQGRLVFGNRDSRLLFRFALFWVLIWLVNVLFIALLIRAGLDAYMAGLVAVAPTTLLSYLVQKRFVFRPPRPEAGGQVLG